MKGDKSQFFIISISSSLLCHRLYCVTCQIIEIHYSAELGEGKREKNRRHKKHRHRLLAELRNASSIFSSSTLRIVYYFILLFELFSAFLSLSSSSSSLLHQTINLWSFVRVSAAWSPSGIKCNYQFVRNVGRKESFSRAAFFFRCTMLVAWTFPFAVMYDIKCNYKIACNLNWKTGGVGEIKFSAC